MSNILDRVSSDNGFVCIGALSGEVTGSYFGFVTLSNIVITSLDINGTEVDLSDYGLDDTTFPDGIPGGFPFLFAKDQIITAIELTSGNIQLLRCPFIKY